MCADETDLDQDLWQDHRSNEAQTLLPASVSRRRDRERLLKTAVDTAVSSEELVQRTRDCKRDRRGKKKHREPTTGRASKLLINSLFSHRSRGPRSLASSSTRLKLLINYSHAGATTAGEFSEYLHSVNEFEQISPKKRRFFCFLNNWRDIIENGINGRSSGHESVAIMKHWRD